MKKKPEYTMREIADYVISKYPKSCIACNDAMYHYDEDGLAKELFAFFVYEIIGLCGCGDNILCCKDIRDYINIKYNHNIDNEKFDISYKKYSDELEKRFEVTDIYDNSLLLFMAYILDDKKLTEHGSSIGGAWITDLGYMCMLVFNFYDLDNAKNDD